jgi:hypothetical protein
MVKSLMGEWRWVDRCGLSYLVFGVTLYLML